MPGHQGGLLQPLPRRFRQQQWERVARLDEERLGTKVLFGHADDPAMEGLDGVSGPRINSSTRMRGSTGRPRSLHSLPNNACVAAFHLGLIASQPHPDGAGPIDRLDGHRVAQPTCGRDRLAGLGDFCEAGLAKSSPHKPPPLLRLIAARVECFRVRARKAQRPRRAPR